MKILFFFILIPLSPLTQVNSRLEISTLTKTVIQTRTISKYSNDDYRYVENASFGYGAKFLISTQKRPRFFYTIGINRLHRKMIADLYIPGEQKENFQQFKHEYNFTSTFLNWGLHREFPVFNNFSFVIGINAIFKFYSDRNYSAVRPLSLFTQSGDLLYSTKLDFNNTYGRIGFGASLLFNYDCSLNSSIGIGISMLPNETFEYDIKVRGISISVNNNVNLIQSVGSSVYKSATFQSLQFGINYTYKFLIKK